MAIVLLFGLSSCSSVYEIRAVVIDDKVAFMPSDTDLWGNSDPACFRSIEVSTIDGPPATPETDDNIDYVKSGDYWFDRGLADQSCANSFPVVYGARLEGPQYAVSAKPLLRGVVYTIATTSPGSAYGVGKFMITEEGRVVNLPV